MFYSRVIKDIRRRVEDGTAKDERQAIDQLEQLQGKRSLQGCLILNFQPTSNYIQNRVKLSNRFCGANFFFFYVPKIFDTGRIYVSFYANFACWGTFMRTAPRLREGFGCGYRGSGP